MLRNRILRTTNPISITYLGSQNTSTDGTSYSWSQSVDPGLLVVAYHAESLSSNVPSYSATIDGANMNIAVSLSNNTSSRQNVAIAYANNTAAGTKTIVTGFGTTNVRCWAAFYLIKGVLQSTPAATTSTGAVAASQTTTFGATSRNHVGIIAITLQTNNTTSFSNATKNYGGTGLETTWHATGASFQSTSPIGRAVTATFTVSDDFASIAAQWI